MRRIVAILVLGAFSFLACGEDPVEECVEDMSGSCENTEDPYWREACWDFVISDCEARFGR